MAQTTDRVFDKTEITSEELPRFSWPHMYLGALGFAISLYAFLVHRRIEAGQNSGCGFGPSFNCDDVIGSKYGVLFGIPLGVFGMAYFVVVILTAINTSRGSTPLKEATQRLFVSALGLGGAAVLAYISYIVIKAACPVCMATHATILVTFIVSLWQFLRARKSAA